MPTNPTHETIDRRRRCRAALRQRTITPLLTLLLLLIVAPAEAVDYELCGVGNTPPVTGWNGHSDTKRRTLTLACGQTETFSVDFHAEITPADVAAGGIVWTLSNDAPGFQTLLEGFFDCPGLLQLGPGTPFVGWVLFRLKCNAGCLVEGVEILEYELTSLTNPPVGCGGVFPPSVPGQSNGQGAQLALRGDVNFNHRMCNTLFIRCSPFASTLSISPGSAPHGADGSILITSDVPAFTDSTDVTFDLEGEIEVLSTTVHDAFTVETSISVPLSVTPGPMSVFVANTIEDAGPGVLPFVIEPVRWATLDAGALSISVTDQGRLGWLDAERTIGDGIALVPGGWPDVSQSADARYGGASGFWAGSDAGYVANRDFTDDPGDADWVATGDPVLFVDEAGYDQAIVSRFVDGGAPAPSGLEIEQRALGFADTFGGRVVHLVYRVTNTSPAPIENHFAGVFLDLDARGDGVDDIGGTDQEEHIAYMRDADGSSIVALVCTKPYDWPRAPGAVAGATGRGLVGGNTSLVDVAALHNADGTFTDADRFALLSADPAYVLTDAPVPGDYGVVMTTGGVTLMPGLTREIVFSIIAGESLDEIRALAYAARLQFDATVPVPAPGEIAPPKPILACAPNPSARGTRIRVGSGGQRVEGLWVFDVGGRLVRDLTPRITGGTPVDLDVMWDGRDRTGARVPSGVYVVRLGVEGGGSHTERLTIVR